MACTAILADVRTAEVPVAPKSRGVSAAMVVLGRPRARLLKRGVPVPSRGVFWMDSSAVAFLHSKIGKF